VLVYDRPQQKSHSLATRAGHFGGEEKENSAESKATESGDGGHVRVSGSQSGCHAHGWMPMRMAKAQKQQS